MINVTIRTTAEQHAQYLADVKEHGAFKAMMLKMSAFDESVVKLTKEASELLVKCKEFCETQLKPEADHPDVIAYLDLVPKIALSLAFKDTETTVDYVSLYQAFELVVGQYPRTVRLIKGEEKPFDPTKLREVKGFSSKGKQAKNKKKR